MQTDILNHNKIENFPVVNKIWGANVEQISSTYEL